ncbi:MAG TPA: CHASE3 domain-containing protein [Flavisolibacter sp.]|nr:CHASE3 domain-containing protein [Flavisolibacter sp.]
MQLSTRLARLIFIFTSCILLILSFISFTQVKDLITSYNQVHEATIVNLKLEQVLSTLKDAEIAQRGFLLTRDSGFLKPMVGAREKAEYLLNELHTLTHNNAEQQKNLDALETFVKIRFKNFNTVIDQYSMEGISAETRKTHLLASATSMDNIRQHIVVIQDIENRLLKERERVKKKHSVLAPLYAFLLILTALAILIFFYDRTMKQLVRTRKLLGKLRIVNRKLRQKNHEMELYNKELDSFAYIASHDLKEPLRKISTYSNLLSEEAGGWLTEKHSSYFERIQHSVKRMQNLLDDLLLYSHSTGATADFEAVDLNNIIKQVKENLALEIKEHNASVHTEALPVIRGLPFQLKQLFENLFLNSLKYKQSGTAPAISIESALIDKTRIKKPGFTKANQYYRIIFKDNGLGFEQTYAEKIFQLFQRVHTNQGDESTGIGLTICKKIIENHNGFIRATSKINRGTLFEIYFPYNKI